MVRREGAGGCMPGTFPPHRSLFLLLPWAAWMPWKDTVNRGDATDALEGGSTQSLGTVIRTSQTRVPIPGWTCLSVPCASSWVNINPKALWDPWHDDRKKAALLPPSSRWPQPLEKQHRGFWLCSYWSCTLPLWPFYKRLHILCLPWFCDPFSSSKSCKSIVRIRGEKESQPHLSLQR